MVHSSTTSILPKMKSSQKLISYLLKYAILLAEGEAEPEELKLHWLACQQQYSTR